MTSILVIDDDIQILSCLRIVLESAGYTTDCTTNGSEALRYCQQKNYDLILCDVFMPDNNGLEVILELRRRKSRTKVIAMSGGSGVGLPNFLDAMIDFGACSTLAKPFDATKLLDAIEEVLCSTV
ncbi:response regulator [Schlesneria paludicola]|uniref:response regulator n=1 Tax=Schlesneria paludicola TaxID=360056 RepID=UPI00029A9AB5|nr:response regulator [Schlesneria paludicola]